MSPRIQNTLLAHQRVSKGGNPNLDQPLTTVELVGELPFCLPCGGREDLKKEEMVLKKALPLWFSPVLLPRLAGKGDSLPSSWKLKPWEDGLIAS